MLDVPNGQTLGGQLGRDQWFGSFVVLWLGWTIDLVSTERMLLVELSSEGGCEEVQQLLRLSRAERELGVYLGGEDAEGTACGHIVRDGVDSLHDGVCGRAVRREILYPARAGVRERHERES
jgi:hypothetical protein